MELAEQYRDFPHGLAVLLGSYLIDAIDDVTAEAKGLPPDLYDRFLGWTDDPGLPA